MAKTCKTCNIEANMKFQMSETFPPISLYAEIHFDHIQFSDFNHCRVQYFISIWDILIVVTPKAMQKSVHRYGISALCTFRICVIRVFYSISNMSFLLLWLFKAPLAPVEGVPHSPLIPIVIIPLNRDLWGDLEVGQRGTTMKMFCGWFFWQEHLRIPGD